MLGILHCFYPNGPEDTMSIIFSVCWSNIAASIARSLASEKTIRIARRHLRVSWYVPTDREQFFENNSSTFGFSVGAQSFQCFSVDNNRYVVYPTIKNMHFCKITVLSTDRFQWHVAGNIVEAASLEVCPRLEISFATGNVFYEPLGSGAPYLAVNSFNRA